MKKSIKREIYCCACDCEVSARLTSGREIYPHRSDLNALPFWKCDACGNAVGCHHKTKDKTLPLGCIPTTEIKRIRQEIHKVIDPLWKRGRVPRGRLYEMLAHLTDKKQYHTAEIRSVEEARNVLKIAREIEGNL